MGNEKNVLHETETHCIDRIEEGKDFEVYFGGHTEERDSLVEPLPCLVGHRVRSCGIGCGELPPCFARSGIRSGNVLPDDFF
jgi:hypothetical protein